MGKKQRLFVILILAAFCFGVSGFTAKSWGQASTHTVKKGDTLWDICQDYYGDPDLWPKLWEMNPFITNPNLLRAGDVITLMEKAPVEKQPAAKEEASPAKVIDDSAQGEVGVDVSGMTNVESMGYFCTLDPEPLGHLLSSESDGLLLSEGNTVHVTIEGDSSVKLGDSLIAYETTRLFKDAFNRHALGSVVTVLGRLVIREEVKGSLYKAEISESYAPIPVGAMIGPHSSISSCVKPVTVDRELTTSIVASKGLQSLISEYSVVYLALGYDQGIRRGNLFELVEEIPGGSAEKSDLDVGGFGYMLILETRPDTATGVVVSSRREFTTKSISVRGLDWTRAQDIFAKIPDCPVE